MNVNLTGNPRLSVRSWVKEQLDDLNLMWQAIQNVINQNAASYPQGIQAVSLTGQAADIAATAFGPGVVAPGLYRCSIYIACTTADGGAGSITVTLGFTDVAQAETVSASPFPLTGLGFETASFFLQVQSGGITYAVTHSGAYLTAVYGLYLVLERLN